MNDRYGWAGESNPRSCDDALAWQLQRVGSKAWEQWSWKFQRLAHGYLRDDGWSDASDALAWFRATHRVRHGSPPRGALVWYTIGADGDPDADPAADSPPTARTETAAMPIVIVRCALGDGRVVGPSIPDAVGLAALDTLTGLNGWADPHFPFAR